MSTDLKILKFTIYFVTLTVKFVPLAHLPDFSSKETWYNSFLFPGKDKSKPLSYTDQAKVYNKAFEAVGNNSPKFTHINRKSAINMMAHQGVPGDQKHQVGRWRSDRMVGCYLSGLPIDAIKVHAGFTVRKGDYFINRDNVIPSAEFLKLIFPQIEEWKQKLFNK